MVRYVRVLPLMLASWVDFQKCMTPAVEVVGEEEETLWMAPPFPISITAMVVASAHSADSAVVMAREMSDRTMVGLKW